ncbi:SDR family NAD(P)-dependent oxidoreductase [Phenylobacterium montanum]|uniref:D-xylose 1-dehydrogenase n=1 Tax=Phenylobacterium montanum TaxID=2823693 RepID=A0A975FWF9_9CAUL|nr:SDR family NAD(P)-dependent oxidoreductase [Caulobacter sp. S6]QUD86524.1 SDR family oxidoreductase [Caulobacter sp. S6]
MAGRLAGKACLITGAGQTPGETVGNGRAMALLFAREGAKVLCIDRRLESAAETVAMIQTEGGEAAAFEADVSRDGDCAAAVAEAGAQFGRLDVLVNNVGIGGRGDGPAHRADEAAFDRILAVNLKSAFLMIRHAIPVMRAQGGGAIVNISSLASIAGGNQVAYEVSKAGMNRLTTSVANANAAHGIRCNAILPGLMDTPMAVAGIANARGEDPEAVRAARNARVPLRGKMGTAWDTAHAALFLASDEAGFITGVLLPVDGGMSARVG